MKDQKIPSEGPEGLRISVFNHGAGGQSSSGRSIPAQAIVDTERPTVDTSLHLPLCQSDKHPSWAIHSSKEKRQNVGKEREVISLQNLTL